MATTEARWQPEHGHLYADAIPEVRRYVRREIVQSNLRDTLSEAFQLPLIGADIGGANGSDSRWVESLHPGNQMYLFEPDAVSLMGALKREQRLRGGERLGDSNMALDEFGPHHFDLVLHHGVLQYIDPKEQLRELTRLADLTIPGGHLSILVPNYNAKLKAIEARDDKAGYVRLRTTGQYANNLGALSSAFAAHQLEEMLRHVGFEPVAHFGVRNLATYLDDCRIFDKLPALERNRIRNAELFASRDPVQKHGGQMLHYVAQKV